MYYYKELQIESFDGEVWKKIEGFEYEVSNYGRIKSLPKRVLIDHERQLFRVTVPKIVKQFLTDRGYCRVQLNNYPVSQKFFVHRLVCTAFHPNPINKPEVNHIDCVKTNNCITNLEWCTNEENYHHAVANGKNLYKKKRVKKYNLGYTPSQCKTVYYFNKSTGKLLGWFLSAGMASRYLKIKENEIRKCCTLATRHSSFNYNFSYTPMLQYSKQLPLL